MDYLKRLNEYYEQWIGNYKEGELLIVDIDELDFAENQEDLGKIINMVSAKLFGLF